MEKGRKEMEFRERKDSDTERLPRSDVASITIREWVQDPSDSVTSLLLDVPEMEM